MSQRRRNQRTRLDEEVAEEIEAAEAAGIDRQIQSTQPIQARSKLGWSIRRDLKKACQQIALDDGMKDYEALEMLLDEALAARTATKVEK